MEYIRYTNPLQLSFNLVFFGILGLVALMAIILRPKLFWPVLIVFSVGTGGILANQYTYVDEYLVGCLIVGLMINWLLKHSSLHSAPADRLGKMHRFVFFLFVVYMIINSSYGIIMLESFRKVRWIMYHVMIGAIAFIITRNNVFTPNARKVSFLVAFTGLGYFLYYLFCGLYFHFLLGMDKFVFQRITWGTPAYTLFPVVIIIPATLILLRDDSHVYRIIGIITIVLGLITSIYYECRAAVLVTVVYVILSFYVVGLKKVITRYSLPYLFLAGFLVVNFISNIEGSFSQEYLGVLKTISSPGESMKDLDRYLCLRISYLPLLRGISYFLFGYGYNAHSSVLYPYAQAYFGDFYSGMREVDPEVGVEAATAFIVDTGLIGCLLLMLNLCFIWRRISKVKSRIRPALLISVLMIFLWSFVINYRDFVLFYLMIMPSGILEQLSKAGQNGASPRQQLL